MSDQPTSPAVDDPDANLNGPSADLASALPPPAAERLHPEPEPEAALAEGAESEAATEVAASMIGDAYALPEAPPEDAAEDAAIDASGEDAAIDASDEDAAIDAVAAGAPAERLHPEPEPEAALVEGAASEAATEVAASMIGDAFGSGAAAPGGATDDVEGHDEPIGSAPEAAPSPDTEVELGVEAAAASEVEAAAEATEPVVPAAPPAPRTAGRLVADALRAAGVRYAFTVPGESFLGVLEALPEAGIRVVTTRHEGGAAFMAEACAQLTGRPAVCLATRAVGAANLAIGLQTAREDSAPVVAIVGQVKRDHRGREGFQEADLVTAFGSLVKFAAEPTTVDELAEATTRAIHEAVSGRPGPVLLALPEDLQDEIVPSETVVSTRRSPAPRPDDAQIRAILQLLAGAERPVILAGAGVLRARTSNDLVRLAEALRVPVVSSWRRGDVMSNDHPLYLGMSGYFAPPTVRERLDMADALLVLGSRLNQPTTSSWAIPAPGMRWAHVDLAPRPADGSDGAPEISVEADVRAFLRDAYARLKTGVLYAPPADARAAHNAADRAAWEAATDVATGEWTGHGVHPGRIIEILRRVLPDEAILTTDAGNFGGWLARGFRFRRPGTFLGPTSGAMGYGLTAAIAAALVHRDRPVVAVCGDGGLSMVMAELETAVREGLKPIVVVFDNQQLGTIRMHQDRRGGEPVGTDLGPIDFAAVSRACGGRGVKIEKDSGFEPALRQALASDRPTVIQLAVDRAWVSVDDTPLT